jgi:hypothetical protein
MWKLYLDMFEGARVPRPRWQVWKLEIDPQARVFEAKSALEWADFVLSFRRRVGDLLYPDWARASESWDGLHVTADAIAAAQGLLLLTPYGAIAPMYWDVESTLWFRWCFRGLAC